MWWPLVQRSGITSLGDMDFRRIDALLVTAFVKRWYSETNSFHFPCEEVTIALHDVHQILILPIQGSGIVASKGEGIPILMLAEWYKELCRARERNESHIASIHGYRRIFMGYAVADTLSLA
ncbi:hypothetical protein V2J09_006022 [Rumex salicifolius]